jgi:ATP-dependent RNA helicase SUPV3L1/SUV3
MSSKSLSSMSSSLPSLANGRAPGAGVTAVLGPTNTGKTHLAIERMLAHSSGIIGLPLRLLAREVYNKIVARVGPAEVALITGEEKIKPPKARFWVSTVEAMPRDLDVSFLAVDEIQIAADLERGHVFTDRILNRRGRDETLLLGAATMRPVIERLLPKASIVTRPRLSQLTFAGDRKLTRQPRRTAIVAFSADEVYAIAELIRRQHGGAAVVLGSLSPRTRNAQVAMFQNGDVDYLIATDAIGMGLNLDVDHVAFASDRKYDGYQFRRLTPAEFSQIAGRAGRHSRDGTFGTSGRCEPFEPELVNALQNHSFDSVKVLQWRNSQLDFSSLAALQASLAKTPSHEALTRAPAAEDMRVLDHAARDPDVRGMATDAAAVERLWDVCQLPDYRKLSPAAHAELVTAVYGFLMREGRIPDNWFAAQIAQADRTDGDIDALSARIAQIRTWTFAANRPDWLRGPERWQNETREIENKLSDALHEKLTERFVDRRTSVLMRRLRENAMLETEIGKTGEVIVEGHTIGRLDGFTFAPSAAEAGSDAKTLQAAAQKALASEIDTRADKLSKAPDEHFVLASDGIIRWTGDAVARLAASDDMLRPRVRIIADERLTGAPRDAVQARLDLWMKTHTEKQLGALFELSKAEDVTGIARGIAFQLVEALGVIERTRIAAELKDLDQSARAALRKYGVRFGAYHVYIPALLKPGPRALASLLWAQKRDDVDLSALTGVQQLAASGRTSLSADKTLDREAYRVLGYKLAGERAVRVDILERLADLIRPALGWRNGSTSPKPPGAFDGRGFTVTQAMTSLTGSAGDDFAAILRALGYRMERRPPLPEPVAPVAEPTDASAGEAPGEEHAASASRLGGEPADADALESAADDAAPAPDDAASPPQAAASDSGDSSAETASPDPENAESGGEQPAPDMTAASEAGANEVAAEAIAELAIPEAVEATDPVVADANSAQPAEAVASDAAAEPVLIEVWRPGGRSEERRPRPQQNRGRPPHRGQRPDANAQSPASPGEAKPAGEGRDDRSDQRRGHRRDNRPDQGGKPAGEQRAFGRPREGQAHDGKPQEGRSKETRPGEGRAQDNRPRNGNREKFGGKGRGDQRRDQGPSHRPFHTSAPPRERERVADPNSPFAKLAALKEQLAGRKDS